MTFEQAKIIKAQIEAKVSAAETVLRSRMAGDPRGELRVIASVDPRLDGTVISFTCGHTSTWAPHFAPPPVGDLRRCYECRLTRPKAQNPNLRGS